MKQQQADAHGHAFENADHNRNLDQRRGHNETISPKVNKVNFNALQNLSVPEGWIEKALAAQPKKKPLLLRPYIIGTAASLVVATVVALTLLLQGGGKPPVPQKALTVQPATAAATEATAPPATAPATQTTGAADAPAAPTAAPAETAAPSAGTVTTYTTQQTVRSSTTTNAPAATTAPAATASAVKPTAAPAQPTQATAPAPTQAATVKPAEPTQAPTAAPTEPPQAPTEPTTISEKNYPWWASDSVGGGDGPYPGQRRTKPIEAWIVENSVFYPSDHLTLTVLNNNGFRREYPLVFIEDDGIKKAFVDTQGELELLKSYWFIFQDDNGHARHWRCQLVEDTTTAIFVLE